MPYLGRRSLENLSQCTWNLQKLAQEAIKVIDFAVICGYRGEVQQNEAFYKGFSRFLYPSSSHNKKPTPAFDFIPCPFIGWDDKESFSKIVDVLKDKAYAMDIPLNFGFDWGWDAGHVEEIPR